MAIHRVDRRKDNMKYFSQRGLAQFGTVKKSSSSRGHEISHLNLLPILPAREQTKTDRSKKKMSLFKFQTLARLAVA